VDRAALETVKDKVDGTKRGAQWRYFAAKFCGGIRGGVEHVRRVRESGGERGSVASVRASATESGTQEDVFVLGTVDFETLDGGERDWGEIATGRVGFLLRAQESRIENGRFYRVGVTYSEQER
jgi:hypothetical protein